jgi:hypothetical protein
LIDFGACVFVDVEAGVFIDVLINVVADVGLAFLYRFCNRYIIQFFMNIRKVHRKPFVDRFISRGQLYPVTVCNKRTL